MNEQTKKEALDEYKSLSSIVEQLESFDFECEACSLKSAAAFIALKEMAEMEILKSVFPYKEIDKIEGLGN